MEAAYDRQGVTIWCGDVLDRLRELPSESVHCVVTSPPYYGLRDYGTAQWEGGDAECDHKRPSQKPSEHVGSDGKLGRNNTNWDHRNEPAYADTCGKCGARRIDQQIGLERTPQEFIAKLVAVFEEVRRVLRKDGTCWVNMGDSYASTPPGNTTKGVSGRSTLHGVASDAYRETLSRSVQQKQNTVGNGFKPKDRMMMPARLAIALCDAGWYLRDEIVWAKPSPMPESVTDRCTKAHEMIYMLTKSPRYSYDREAIAEPSAYPDDNRKARQRQEDYTDRAVNGRIATINPRNATTYPTRTKRSVWTVTSEPFPAAHFATYPRKLIEPCILAGCPETCCAACGDPWVRVVDVQQVPSDRGTVSPRQFAADPRDSGKVRGWGVKRTRRDVETIGFKPSCTCDAGTQPGLVLDPFLGSGTTAQVARDLGRRCWGIELNPEYVREHCTKRLEQGVLF